MKNVFALALLVIITAACRVPFENDIDEFERQDSVSPPPANAHLFVGSSSFRLWDDIHEDFAGRTIINRGFGGSTFKDILYHADEIIVAYRPKQVIIYCGENDLANGMSPNTVLRRFKRLFRNLRADLPAASILFVSIKPSPSRANIREQVIKTNAMIKEFLKTEERAEFVDVYSLMIDPKGAPRGILFVQDSLHLNRQGYEIWKKALDPYLK